MEKISIAQTEEDATQELFPPFPVPLLDPYEAYELFHNQYGTGLPGDLEILQAEGTFCCQSGRPLMVGEKRRMARQQKSRKAGKDMCWLSAWYRETYLQDQLIELHNKQNRLQEIPEAIQNLLDEMGKKKKRA